ncbi:hypothetical protein [Streptococcus porcinus]|uniref:Uncharacterized protein n=1 Tax=Streptococcus porcinus TaxID=1340 RepID=A0A4V6LZG9_STRPO|nr:hypothetical protein [Streptococcus porcinus]VTT44570.1 Uncharacterised protein [Streptococcus porcinus]VTT45919.1 Uncharacterised protein [Streptococcus porcinus]
MKYAILSNGMQMPIEELLLNDDDLATCVGKSKKQVQKFLREMEKDPVGQQYISHFSRRSTNLPAFKAWIFYRENQKYKAKKEPFKFKIGDNIC